MTRRGGLIARWLAAWAMVTPWAAAAAQDRALEAGEAAEIVSAADLVERYLAERGLTELMAAQLRERLSAAVAEAKPALAERLGEIYAQRITGAESTAERVHFEGLGSALLEEIPGSDAFALRISLARARYLPAERIAERHRLALADEAEIAEAVRILSGVAPEVSAIGDRAHARVVSLERRESRGSDAGDGLVALRGLLAEARRHRSLAMYYAGWSWLYLALLTDQVGHAAEAESRFGYLFGASGERPSVQNVSPSALRLEHVARSAVGVALCRSMQGDVGVAELWLDELERAEDLPGVVREQLFARRVAVLAEAGRDEALARYVRERAPAEGLTTTQARLLAVLLLERRDAGQVSSAGRPEDVRSEMVQAALAVLIERGELGQILDLFDRYGTLPLGSEGFISRYVRAIRHYEAAREAHRALDPERALGPTDRAEVRSLYVTAVAGLEEAAGADDAGRYAAERDRARTLAGLCLFYKGDAAEAADRFEALASAAAPGATKSEALWLSIVAIEHAVDGGRADLVERRDRLATLFIEGASDDPRAATLILRLGGDAGLGDERAAAILLSVPRGESAYADARRQAARTMLRLHRSADAATRPARAAAFLTVAAEVLALETENARAAAGDPQRLRGALSDAITLSRQMLDVMLEGQAPDADRAEALIDRLEGTAALAAQRGVAVDDGLGDELRYRRLQVAIARGDGAKIEALADELGGAGSAYARAADRLLYLRAQRAFARDGDDHQAARGVVRHGLAVFEAAGGDATALAARGMIGLAEAVAAAAAAVWQATGERAMLDAARGLDGLRLEAGRASEESIRRYALLSERAGEPSEVARAWGTLSAAVSAPDPRWFEARAMLIAALRASDPPAARAALDQHKALYPDLGPEPWRTRLAELDAAVPARFDAPANAPANDPVNDPAPGVGGGR